MNIKKFIKSNQIFKIVVCCTTFIFPILCMIYIGGNTKVIAFEYIWVAFYSSLLFCLAYESKAAKIIICSMNGIFVIGLTLLFLMGGSEIIPGVLWNAVVPFLSNPWY